MATYRHTQYATLLISLYVVAAAALLIATVKDGWSTPLIMVGVAIGFTLYLFHSLTVTVTDRRVKVRFGPGLIRKSFRLKDVQSVTVVRNRWIYGWGIRLTPHGWLYSVSGLDAVELTLAGRGRKVRIGTDQPALLAAAIRRACADVTPQLT